MDHRGILISQEGAIHVEVSSIVLPKKKPSENRVTHGVTHGAFESADFV